MAAIITLIVTLSLTLYAVTTKNDVTLKGAICYILGSDLLFFLYFTIWY